MLVQWVDPVTGETRRAPGVTKLEECDDEIYLYDADGALAVPATTDLFCFGKPS
jgi:hypothetical protein